MKNNNCDAKNDAFCQKFVFFSNEAGHAGNHEFATLGQLSCADQGESVKAGLAVLLLKKRLGAQVVDELGPNDANFCD